MRVPNVSKIEYEVADVDEDDFVTLIQGDGSLKQNLKLPVDDEKIYPELKKIWDERDDKTVLFSVISACSS
jgi:translation initiation factor 5A